MKSKISRWRFVRSLTRSISPPQSAARLAALLVMGEHMFVRVATPADGFKQRSDPNHLPHRARGVSALGHYHRLPSRLWRNWETPQGAGLVTLTGPGGSNPLRRT